MPSPHDFRPTASLAVLQQRAKLLQEARDFFTRHKYWEVQTPILSRDCCIDLWLDPFILDLGRGQTAYLQTSPEFALKRLVCSGADRIFEIARVFRQDETGSRHNPEFTMVEWYARNCDHHDQMDFVEELATSLREFSASWNWIDVPSSSQRKFERITYEEAFMRFAGLSPSQASNGELHALARQQCGSVPQGMEEDRDGLLNFLLAELVEPGLMQMEAVFLYDFPASQAALAKVHPGPPAVAERFELYLNGAEICNGYHELTDAEVLRARMLEQNQKRVELGKTSLPVESRLLQAMELGMPECTGVALGFDRLTMWCLGLSSIQEVIAFPFDRA